MAKDITTILKEKANDVLTEETLNLIQQAIEDKANEKAKLQVEAALAAQDDDYAAKLQTVLEALDKDHTLKLQQVVKAIDANNTAKLQSVIKKYSGIVNEQAGAFKNSMIDKISSYLDLYLEKKVPQASINEAVKNRKAMAILESLRGSLAVDTALMKKAIKVAVVDGKTQITEARKQAQQAINEAAVLKANLAKTQAELILEQKTAGLPTAKKAYAVRVLKDKAPKFIVENIDYTLSLYDKKEEERLTTLREEANNGRKTGNDVVVVQEEVEVEQPTTNSPLTNLYMEELNRY